MRDNRLGVNSILDYVVSGRVEGLACARYDRAKALAGGGKVEGSKSDQAIVVNTLLKNGGSVVLLDKATSGINGARTLREKDSADSSDTLKGGAKKPELAKLRKLSSFQCAKRCKSRTLRSAAKRELRGVTLLTSMHSCGCPLSLFFSRMSPEAIYRTATATANFFCLLVARDLVTTFSTSALMSES